MEWFLLEALVALLIAVVIVWWTMGPQAPQASAAIRDAAIRAGDARSMQHARHRQRERRESSRRTSRPSSATIW